MVLWAGRFPAIGPPSIRRRRPPHMVVGSVKSSPFNPFAPLNPDPYCDGGAELATPGDGASGWCQRVGGRMGQVRTSGSRKWG
ncbi:hypothetical protein PVK06_009967 [Gossypium arboreum]|uniref:Uncharacterized protein n=1 Tax=Gossypium arboreum TaxID=29729 RepID=A0ABR0QP29_GOSAR|nr:hypothetical protein PVK06_009967 [Gossypium arboreum]